MENITLQYIAGFFDGEGSIGIYLNGSGSCCGLRSAVTLNPESSLPLSDSEYCICEKCEYCGKIMK